MSTGSPTEPDVLDLLRRGESESVEFKTRLPSDPLVARDLVALGNSGGGVFLVGVGDRGEPIGLTDEEAILATTRLHNLTSSLFPWPTQIGLTELYGKSILYAVIQPAPAHLSPVMTSTGEVFKREGAATRKVPSPRGGPTVSRTIGRSCSVFVAMSFHSEQEPALVDYFRAMERAVEHTLLPIILVRMDLVEGDYEISQQLMDEIDRADIVIGDFTLSPANVYFELGYSRGRGKRVIQTARQGTPLEFDVRNWRTVFYRNATDLEEKLMPELISAYASVVGPSV